MSDSCENLSNETITSCLSMTCKDFYAHCTVPTFDDGNVWFDTTCIFYGAQLRRVGITKVHMIVRVITCIGSEVAIAVSVADDDETHNISAKYGRNLAKEGVDALTYALAEIVLGTKAINKLQQGVLVAHIEAISHKLRKIWTEQTKLFNGYAALTGKSN